MCTPDMWVEEGKSQSGNHLPEVVQILEKGWATRLQILPVPEVEGGLRGNSSLANALLKNQWEGASLSEAG